MALAGAAVIDAYSSSGGQRKNITRDVIAASESSQMDEDEEALRCLLDDGFNRRSEVLEKIRRSVRNNNALQFADRPTFFRALNRALADSNWDVRHQCIQLLAEVVPLLGSGDALPTVDECVAFVLVRLIACIGDSKITVRRVVTQALHTYMRHTAKVGHFLHQYVTLGLENVEARVRREAVLALPLLLTAEFAGESYSDIIASLCHKLDGGMRPEDTATQRAALVTLDRLRELVGEARFREQLASCGQLVRECYCRAVAVDFGKVGSKASGSRSSATTTASAAEEYEPGNDGSGGGSAVDDLELGVLPAGLLAQLNADRDDFRARGQAAERLKEALERLPRGGTSAAATSGYSAIARHLSQLLNVVSSLLDDANFRVVTLALDALTVLIDRAGRDARPHVRAVVAALTRRMGDNKTVVRASVARAALQLMQSLGPQPVLAALAENTGHRNSRVRAETLNLLIAALLTFPSTDIDLPAACSNAACCLADARRSVRHAALECIAVLAQCLGPARSAPLGRAVDAVELHYDGHGVADAVAARLSRRVLPRRDDDGLVEYALQLPTGAGTGGTSGKAGVAGGSGGSAMPPGADIDWVMAGSGAGGGGGSSARSIRLEDLEVAAAGGGSSAQADASAAPPSKKQSTYGGPAPAAAAQTASVKSTPRGSKLPWADSVDNGGSMYSSMQLSQAAMKDVTNGTARTLPATSAAPKQTWTDALPQQTFDTANGTSSLRKVVRRSSNGVAAAGDSYSLISNGVADSQNDSAALQGDHHSAAAMAAAAGGATLAASSSAPGGSQQQPTARPTFSKAPPRGAAAGATAAAAAVATAAPVAASTGPAAAAVATSKGPPDIRGDLSSSWPGNKRFAGSSTAAAVGDDGGGNGTLGRRPILDPISAPDTPLPAQQPSPAWGGNTEDRRGRAGRDVESSSANEDSPVPIKPKLVRSASRGRALAAAVAATSSGSKAQPVQPLPPERSSSPRRGDGLGLAGPPGVDDTDSAYGTIDLDYDNGLDAQDGLMSSLNKIRHSASKKKAEKLFRKLELKESIGASGNQDGNLGAHTPASASPPTSSPEPAASAGVMQTTPSTSRSNPFEAKAKLARRSSNPARGVGSPVSAGDDASGGSATARNEPIRPEFNPLAGVTFRRGGEQADGVSIVGRGYGDDASFADPKPTVLAPNRSQREKRRTGIATIIPAGGKGPRLSPLAIAAMPASTQDDDHVTVIGHGMFDGAGSSTGGGQGPATAEHHQQQHQHVQPAMTMRSLALAASNLKGSDPGLIPVHAMAAASAFRPVAADSDGFAGEDASGEEVLLAPALRDQMAARRKKTEEAAMLRRHQQRQQEEERESEGASKFDRLWPEQLQEPATVERRRRTEQATDKRPRLAGDHRPADNLNATDAVGHDHAAPAGSNGNLIDEGRGTSLLVAGVSPSKAATSSAPDSSKPPTGKRSQQQPPPARRRTASPAGYTAAGSAVQPPPHSAGGGGQEELSPFNDPDAALRDVYRLLADDDWNSKYDGLMMVRRLAAYHDDVLREQAHTVAVALVKEVQNLRSQVARLAVVALGDMFARLKRVMDAELDVTAKILLHKNGESNEFIRVELEKSLRVMVEETTPQRALTAVVNGGASHKNQAVRRVVAQLLDTLAEKLGPDRLLSGAKDVTDRFLPVLAQLTTDASPETRWYARKVILSLMDHQDFERALAKFLSPTMQRTVKDICEVLRSKGLGDMPMEAPSAKGRRSGIVSRSRTGSSDSIPLLGIDATSPAGSAAGSKAPAAAVSATPPAVRKALFRIGDDELVKQLCATLTASDWQQRYDGIDQLADLCDSNPDLVASHIVRIFDKFIPLLRDSNSKVNLHALQTLSSRMLIPLAGSMGQVTSLAVQTAAANLASKNREVCEAASDLLDAFTKHLDNALLIQPFANQATVCTPKVKPPLIAHVQQLAERVYPRKPKHVVLHVLPLLWHLLSASGSSGEVRKATAALAAVLHRLMGTDLVDEAAGNSLVSAACVRLLREMIEGAATAQPTDNGGYRVS